jgi:hypothetical protein
MEQSQLVSGLVISALRNHCANQPQNPYDEKTKQKQAADCSKIKPNFLPTALDDFDAHESQGC